MRKLYGDWRDIFYCFGIALLSPRKLLMSLSAIVAMAVGVFIINVALAGMLETDGTNLHDIWVMFVDATVFMLRGFGHYPLLELLRIASHVPRDMHNLFGVFGYVYYGLCIFPWCWMICCHYGAAVSRIAAVNIAHDMDPRTAEVMAFVRANYRNFFWPAVMILVFIGFFLSLIALPALTTRIPVAGEFFKWVWALLFPLLFLAGFIAAIMSVGALLGWIFIIPTVSAEGADTYDAISRSYSYTMQKPIHYVCYVTLAAAWGVATWLVVSYFAQFVTDVILFALRLGLARSSYDHITALLNLQYVAFEGNMPLGDAVLGIGIFVVFCVFNLVMMSYAFSYFFTASTMIFMLLRKKIDGISMERIYRTDEAKPATEPAATPKETTQPPEEQ